MTDHEQLCRSIAEVDGWTDFWDVLDPDCSRPVYHHYGKFKGAGNIIPDCFGPRQTVRMLEWLADSEPMTIDKVDYPNTHVYALNFDVPCDPQGRGETLAIATARAYLAARQQEKEGN